MGEARKRYKTSKEDSEAILKTLDGVSTLLHLEAEDGTIFFVEGVVSYAEGGKSSITSKDGRSYCLSDYPLADWA